MYRKNMRGQFGHNHVKIFYGSITGFYSFVPKSGKGIPFENRFCELITTRATSDVLTDNGLFKLSMNKSHSSGLPVLKYGTCKEYTGESGSPGDE